MLTDAHCRNAICPPEKKRERLSDSGGLYLEVSPNGSKCWFWKYRLAGLEKRLALGGYPDIGLGDSVEKVLLIKAILDKAGPRDGEAQG